MNILAFSEFRMKLSVISLLLCLSLTIASGKRIRESIYEPLQGISFCFKRANGSHEMGCSSDLNGNVGVVHLILSREDLDWLVKQGPHQPYMGTVTPVETKA
jgi:Nicastrin small lobe